MMSFPSPLVSARSSVSSLAPPSVLRRIAPALLTLVCAVGWVPAAFAQAPLTGEQIVFDFTGSTFSLLGGTISTPPDGTVDVGTATLFVEASAPGSYVNGGAFVVEALEIGGTVDANVLGSAAVSGTWSALLAQPWSGTLAAGASGGDFVDDLMLDVDIVLGCTGFGCASLGLPVNDSGLSILSVSFLPVLELGTPGAATIQASFAIDVGGVLGQIDLVGVETVRSFIPEPGTALLVGLGLAGLASARRRARR